MSPTNETGGSQSSSSGGAGDQGSSSGGTGDQVVKQTSTGKSDQGKRKGKQLLESIENPPVPKQVGRREHKTSLQ